MGRGVDESQMVGVGGSKVDKSCYEEYSYQTITTWLRKKKKQNYLRGGVIPFVRSAIRALKLPGTSGSA